MSSSKRSRGSNRYFDLMGGGGVCRVLHHRCHLDHD